MFAWPAPLPCLYLRQAYGRRFLRGPSVANEAQHLALVGIRRRPDRIESPQRVNHCNCFLLAHHGEIDPHLSIVRCKLFECGLLGCVSVDILLE